MPRHCAIFYADEGPTTKEAARTVVSFPHQLSVSPETTEAELREVLLARVVTTACWTGRDVVGSNTTSNEFGWTDLAWVDLDDGHLTMADFVKLMQDVTYILYTSTNHLRPKNGVTCERYKVLFPLTRRVYDLGRHTRFLGKLVEALGSDPNGSQAKQKYFPPYAPNPTLIYHVGSLDVKDWLAAQRAVRQRDGGTVGRGTRNAWLFKEACRLAIAGKDEAGILAALQDARDLRCEDPDDRELGDEVLTDMARRALIRFSDSPYAAVYRFYESRYVKVRDPLGVYDLVRGRLTTWDNSTKFYQTVPDNYVTMDDGKVLDVWRTWLRFSRQHVDTVEFAPDQPARSIRTTQRAGHPYLILNTFTGMVEPTELGSCSAYRNFIREVVCAGDESLYAWVWNYLAYIYQNPADRERRFCYAVALSGNQGTGKNTFVEIFGKLFKEAYVLINNVEDILSFNGELAGKIVVLFDEAFSASWKNVRRLLKSLITGRVIPINEKFVPKYHLANHTRFFFATNDLHSAPVEPGDRRYVCLELSDIHREDHAYFAAIHNEINLQGGLGRLAWELSQHVVDMRILERRPQTARWHENMQLAWDEGDPVRSYLSDLLEADDPVMADVGTGFWQFLQENEGYVSKRILLEEVNRHAQRLRLRAVSVKGLTASLRQIFKHLPEARRQVDGHRECFYRLGTRGNVEEALRGVGYRKES